MQARLHRPGTARSLVGFVVVAALLAVSSAAAQVAAEPTALLASPVLDERFTAVRTLLDTGDPAVLDELGRAIGEAAGESFEREDYDRFRHGVIAASLETFPAEAFALFRRLLAEGDEFQREAATYGLGFTGSPAATALLMPLVNDPQSGTRRAAVLSLAQAGRDAAMLALAYSGNPTAPPAEQDRRVVTGTLDRVVELVLSDVPLAGPEVYELLHRFGTNDATQRVVEHYCSGLQDPALADLLRRMLHVNRRWLGRAAPPPVEQVTYRFEMSNEVTDRSSDFRLYFTPRVMELLRVLDYYVDRGVHLELPLDGLFVYPGLYGVKRDGTAGPGRLRYVPPAPARLKVGMGAMAMPSWTTRLAGMAEVTLEVDLQRAVPLAEEFFGRRGELLASIRYSDYADAGAGALVPLRIEIDLPHGDPDRHLRYRLDFQVRRPGVWLLAEALAEEILPEGGTRVVARANVRGVRIDGDASIVRREANDGRDHPFSP